MESNGWLREYLKGIKDDIGRLDGKVDTFITETCPQRHKGTEDRVAKMETDIKIRKGINKWIIAAVATISSAISAIVSIIIK